MKTCILRAAVMLLAATTLPASAQQSLIPALSEIVFTSTQMGVPVHGKFSKFNARIAFDPGKPESGKVAFTIDVASASLGVPELDAELAKSSWFDSKRYAQASFEGGAAKALGSGKFDIAGKLTIKGRTRDIVIPIAITRTGATTSATGAFVLKRLDFGIGEGDWKDTSMVSNEVQVKFKLALKGLSI